jgi:hypothetical protein
MLPPLPANGTPKYVALAMICRAKPADAECRMPWYCSSALTYTTMVLIQ